MESDEMIPNEIMYEGEDIDLEDELDEVAELPPPKNAKTNQIRTTPLQWNPQWIIQSLNQ